MEFNRERAKKGLECCTLRDCASCPYYLLHYTCREQMNSDLFVLVKKLTDENERLNAQVDMWKSTAYCEKDRVESIKIDTVRKMQERFENSFAKLDEYFNEDSYESMVFSSAVLELLDQITKEMLEGG